MPYFRKPAMLFWSFPFLIFLTGCDAKPECDSFETRNAVLKTVSDDHNNALIKYAVRNSTMAKSSDASAEANNSKQQPLYALAEKIATTSTSENKRTLKCSGSMSVTIGETKASKEINFTVQQSPDGNISVSVDPFQF
jgi:predicted membrane-bound mannosyltransferase